MAVKNEKFGFVVFGDVKVGEPDGAFVVIDELPAADTRFGAPYEESADWVLPHDGVKEALDLVFSPDERALDVRQPESSIFLLVVEVTDHFTNGFFLVFHSSAPIGG